MNFTDKLNAARTANLGELTSTRLRSDIAINDALRREAIKSLTQKLEEIYEELDLDLDTLHRKIAASRRSEYGRVPALINILAATYAWPIHNNSEAANISQYQEQMADLLHLDAEILLDLKEAKGYHSFLNEDFEIVDGVEPDYEEYQYYILTVADALQIPYVDNKINTTTWTNNETKALAKISVEQAEAATALARHNQLMAS
jgi:intein/homing endonuclease